MLHSGYCVNSDVTFWVTMSTLMLHSGYCVNSDVTFRLLCQLWCYFVAQSIAPQFWDKGGLLEKYISWRTHSCNTLCFWTILSSYLASGPFSQSIVYGQKLHNLDLIVFSGYPIFGYPIFGYPSLSSRSVFGSCLSCLHVLSESSCCIIHPGPFYIRFRSSLVAGQCW